MPVDIAKTYLEIQQLRKEVHKAELDLIIAFGPPPTGYLHDRCMNASGLQAINSQMLLLKRSQN